MLTDKKIFEINPTDNRPRVTIVIVTYNSLKDVGQCIESILKNTSVPYEIIAIDNCSVDGTKEFLTELRNKFILKAILNNTNRGFSAATNQGIVGAKGEYIILLNPDTIVTKNWVRHLMQHFDGGTGAVGPISNYVAGKQKIEFYLREWLNGEINIDKLSEYIYLWNEKEGVETKLLIGFCIMLRTAIIDKIGMLDEDLFLGSDDLEYSLRLRAQGYKLKVATDTFIYHKGQASFNTEPSKKMKRLTQESQDALFKKLEIIYGQGMVPSSLELWGMDWFMPTQLETVEL